MLRTLKIAALFSGALFVGAFLGTTPAISTAHAGATAQPPHDPNKKKAGDPCKSSDECQKHHTCARVNDKNICQEPPRAPLPPGAVT